MYLKSIFRFSSKYVSTTIQAHAMGLKEEANGIISDHNSLIKGKYEGINFPVIFKQAYGNKLRDLLDTGWPSLHLISDRLKNLLEENHFTGWKIYPIKLLDKKSNEILGYHGFSITGRCGPTSYDKSEIIEKQFIPNGPIVKFYKGEFIDEATWDGTDFFIPEKTIGIVITQGVADILKKNKITNLLLRNLDEIEIDVDIIPKKS